MDGRTERWRAHRERRREEFVDAALRALDRHGPGVAVTQIAAEARVAKPRLYRYFQDKADLFVAVGERLSTILLRRLTAVLDPGDAPARLVRRGLEEFLGVVEEHPNAFRLLMHPDRKIADMLATLIARQLDALGVDTSGARPWGHALAGAVGGATHWWLEHGSITRQQLTDHLATVILGSLEGIAKSAGVAVDPEQPIIGRVPSAR
jgi:AcrR family transcriptional regulator